MVQFHEHIISDLLEDENGGLVILSSGLSLSKLIATLLSLHSSDQGTLLILSANPSQRKSILLSNPNPNPNPNFNGGPIEINTELPSHQRHALYSSGGVYFITSRILIVDLLTSKIPTSKIAGILILNAHSLTETSTEAFIVRILRSLNRNAYIRAFSDKPCAMVSGFAKAERIMKCLFVRKLHLWPRFQVYVSQELERNPSEVVDFRVPMNVAMKGIQKAIIEVMDACLKEMRKTNKVDVEDLTVENGLFKSFDEIIRRQLDPIWHNLGKKTKQLVSDLKTLRKLLDYLVRYDAVTYLKYLDSLRASESFRSVWIFAESSYKIFEYAKKRVYLFTRSEAGTSSGQNENVTGKKRKLKESSNEKQGGGVFLQEILEEPPKWKVLLDILEEIEVERTKQASSIDELVGANEDDNNGIVLVACKDEHSCIQLEDCIRNGPKKVMREEWEKYLLSKVELKGYQGRRKGAKKKAKEPKGFGILDGVAKNTKEDAGSSSINKQENDALLAAASAIRNLSKNKVVEGQPDVDNEENARGRRKGKSKKTSQEKQNLEKHNKTQYNSKTSDKSQVASPDTGGVRNGNAGTEDGFHEGMQRTLHAGNGFLRRHTEDVITDAMTNRGTLPPVHFHALESDLAILDILKPSVIIMYHPDIAFVREVEVYNAENPSKKLKVYFLFYEDSTEVQKFEASIRRENGAFESLIRQKSMMMIPVNLDDHLLGVNSPIEPQSSVAQNSLTRKAGGRKEADKEMQVIVDMREFMSSLPNVLHQKGMRIIPVTLEVGDYILSPSICVERKSIQDLFGSFASGRLYHQVETMVRYYRIPVLLIEFSQDKSFSFLELDPYVFKQRSYLEE
ncbi:DNA repair endonuclease UVH1 isoform X2 [Beta vulgaris subsp. vulgaris]|uniref:DNA repair endonuclease UVH1 isoform X2 n=1 Tax=Beta vulgaris subsp. vulgaris TaxID=3555 RepID=UPI002036BE07|nr:DNA repair endonuclease UVH1 isoform X2 [Beta vulgaris subsp. vulgaris]